MAKVRGQDRCALPDAVLTSNDREGELRGDSNGACVEMVLGCPSRHRQPRVENMEMHAVNSSKQTWFYIGYVWALRERRAGRRWTT